MLQQRLGAMLVGAACLSIVTTANALRCYSQTRGCMDPDCSFDLCSRGEEVCHVTVTTQVNSLDTVIARTSRGCQQRPPPGVPLEEPVCESKSERVSSCTVYCSSDLCNRMRLDFTTPSVSTPGSSRSSMLTPSSQLQTAASSDSTVSMTTTSRLGHVTTPPSRSSGDKAKTSITVMVAVTFSLVLAVAAQWLL